MMNVRQRIRFFSKNHIAMSLIVMLCVSFVAGFFSPHLALAQAPTLPNPPIDQIERVGLHILQVHELDEVATALTDLHAPGPSQVLGTDTDSVIDETSLDNHKWRYVTIPFTLDDLHRLYEWQQFFNEAREQKVIPLVRLTTRFENNAWKQPNRKEVVDQIAALNSLEWPTQRKHIIIFNEVNHAPEWGGEISPETYAEYLLFASQWAKAESPDFVVLPAAMDLAAPNGPRTMEAFNYMNRMLIAQPDVFDYIDIWNSHSYPNPAFSAAPNRTGQNSLRGFQYELDFIKRRTGRDLPVMITETGWDLNRSRQRQLPQYYAYALQHIWSDSRVLAVTPFILRGDPGPFAGFGFVDSTNQPTQQYEALKWALQAVK